MKKLLRFFITSVLGLSVLSCYDDSAIRETLDDHENRLAQLETLCGKINEDLSDLQTLITALQNADYVTGIVPVTEGGVEVGYTITFAKYGNVTIRHGSDGVDSTYIPVFGIKKDDDGVYCWTLDGQWILDENGNRMPATGAAGATGATGDKGDQGETGQPGADGATGPAGVTPLLKIEEGYWYVSYDDGVEWTRLDKAVGENGADGADGADSIFKDVYKENGCIYIVLTDGTVYELPLKDNTVALDILFDVEQGYAGVPEAMFAVNYTVVGGDANTLVRVFAQDGYAYAYVKPETPSNGKLYVYLDSEFNGLDDPDRDEILDTDFGDMTVEEYYNSMLSIVVQVSDGENNTILKALNFTEGHVSSVEDAYLAESAGGKVAVKVQTNTDFYIQTPENVDWISYEPSTKADLRIDEIELTVTPNTSEMFRTASVSIVTNLGNEICSFVVIQRSAIAGLEMTFADSSVKKACVMAFDANLDGILTYEEAALVKDLKALQMPKDAKSFDEFKHFTSVKRIPSHQFTKCDQLVSITLPESLTSIGTGAFESCCSLKSIIIPNGVQEIGVVTDDELNMNIYYSGVFANCKALETVDIPATCVYMDTQSMFSGCSSLKSVSLPDITYIGGSMFSYCDNLESFEIPSTVNVIESAAFAGCSSLKTIVLPEALEYISSQAFYESGLTGILVIPARVQYIGYRAFYDCPNLEGLRFLSEQPCNIEYEFCDRSVLIYVPDECYDTYRNNWYYAGTFTWADKAANRLIRIDGKFSDWETIDPSKMSVATCGVDPMYPALEVAKVYADEQTINVYLKFNEKYIDKYLSHQLQIFVDGDVNDNTGFEYLWTDSSIDWLFDGILMSDEYNTSYDPYIAMWQGSNENEFAFGVCVYENSGITYCAGNGYDEFELSMDVEMMNSYGVKFAPEFAMSFIFWGPYEYGVLPNEVLEDGTVPMLKVKTVF